MEGGEAVGEDLADGAEALVGAGDLVDGAVLVEAGAGALVGEGVAEGSAVGRAVLEAGAAGAGASGDAAGHSLYLTVLLRGISPVISVVWDTEFYPLTICISVRVIWKADQPSSSLIRLPELLPMGRNRQGIPIPNGIPI